MGPGSPSLTPCTPEKSSRQHVMVCDAQCRQQASSDCSRSARRCVWMKVSACATGACSAGCLVSMLLALCDRDQCGDCFVPSGTTSSCPPLHPQPQAALLLQPWPSTHPAALTPMAPLGATNCRAAPSLHGAPWPHYPLPLLAPSRSTPRLQGLPPQPTVCSFFSGGSSSISGLS